MYQVDRLRRLGDKRSGEWQKTVVEGGPRWSGNVPVRTGEPGEEPEEASPTPITVHALLTIYEKDDAAADAWAAEVEAALAPHGITIVHRLPLELRLDPKGIAKEHFGFADGVSQPVPFEAGSVSLDGKDCPKDYWHGIPLGEVLLGHVDAHQETPTGPVVPIDSEGKLDQSMLSADGAPTGFLSLGANGSYMVVRELKQDVAQFWESMKRGAEHLRERDPDNTKDVDEFWIADRVIGRNMDGAMLCPRGKFLPPDQYDQPQNEFGFFERDYQGHGCPPGSHVRRANPRDALAPNKENRQTLLDAANNHRILRRGRKYGTTLARGAPDDGKERGLLFICLNTDIARQFEFVQQTWLLNSTFATLYHETDPLIGPPGKMTIREDPLRRIVDVETFVQLTGGEYFFLPSMPALRYMAQL
jgi:Dyp-type peroxidase family